MGWWDGGRGSPNRGEIVRHSQGSNAGLSFLLKPMRAVIHLVQLIGKFPRLEEFIYRFATTWPMAVVIERDESPRNNPVVKCFQAQLNGLVPICINIKQCNLRG